LTCPRVIRLTGSSSLVCFCIGILVVFCGPPLSGLGSSQEHGHSQFQNFFLTTSFPIVFSFSGCTLPGFFSILSANFSFPHLALVSSGAPTPRVYALLFGASSSFLPNTKPFFLLPVFGFFFFSGSECVCRLFFAPRGRFLVGGPSLPLTSWDKSFFHVLFLAQSSSGPPQISFRCCFIRR